MENERVGIRTLSIFASSAFILTSSFFASPALSANQVGHQQEALEACILTVGRVDRLACFDQLFETPLDVVSASEPQAEFAIIENVPAGPFEHQAKKMERSRSLNDINWQFRFGAIGHPAIFRWEEIKSRREVKQIEDARDGTIPEKTQVTVNRLQQEPIIEPGATNVYLSMNEFRSSDALTDEEPAILLLSCVEDITTAALILNKAHDKRRIPLRILLKNEQTDNDIWQSAESKRVLISPRGLMSIAYINRWSQVDRVQFEVMFKGRSHAYLFEMVNLKNMLGPIQSACHW